MNCRHCGNPLKHTLVDLGTAPPSNAYLSEEALGLPEKYFPLRVLVCDHCWLVQTEDFLGAKELFSEDYAYFSSYSASWLEHARRYAEKTIPQFNLDKESLVVEVAANDGYLLRFFQEKGIPNYGIEPTKSTALAAKGMAIDIIEEFLTLGLARQLREQRGQADLLVANNVLAHVPDINDFVQACAELIKPSGVASFEFPHLLNLVDQCQFDTIYHEHYSYLSLTSVRTIFQANDLEIFDVEELTTHGGSLRIYARRSNKTNSAIDSAVTRIQQRENQAGLSSLDYYLGFQQKVEKIKIDFLSFLSDARQAQKKVAAYGAAAKGNTLLNFVSVGPEDLLYVVDRNPAKQGKYLPGSHIPICDEAKLKMDRPDFVLVLPWNLKREVISQLSYVREWGAMFVTAVPSVQIG